MPSLKIFTIKRKLHPLIGLDWFGYWLFEVAVVVVVVVVVCRIVVLIRLITITRCPHSKSQTHVK